MSAVPWQDTRNALKCDLNSPEVLTRLYCTVVTYGHVWCSMFSLPLLKTSKLNNASISYFHKVMKNHYWNTWNVTNTWWWYGSVINTKIFMVSVLSRVRGGCGTWPSQWMTINLQLRNSRQSAQFTCKRPENDMQNDAKWNKFQ
jgi:hypothetical protein